MSPVPGPGTQAPVAARERTNAARQPPIAACAAAVGWNDSWARWKPTASRPPWTSACGIDGDPPLPVLRGVVVGAGLAPLGGPVEVEEGRAGPRGHPAQRVRQGREQHGAAPLRVGAAVRAALHRVERDHALGDRRGVGGQHEPPRAVGVTGAAHRRPDVADGLLDGAAVVAIRCGTSGPTRLAARRGEHVEERLDARDAGVDERRVVVGPDLQDHRRHAVAAGHPDELGGLRALAVLAAPGVDVGGVGPRAREVDRDRRQIGSRRCRRAGSGGTSRHPRRGCRARSRPRPRRTRRCRPGPRPRHWGCGRGGPGAAEDGSDGADEDEKRGGERAGHGACTVGTRADG